MLFCPKCKSIMRPVQEGKKKVLKCSCGYSAKGDVKIAEKTKKKELSIGVVEKEEQIYAKTEAECPKCGNKEAYNWEQQMRAADEPPTSFFKCTKCNYTWRDKR